MDDKTVDSQTAGEFPLEIVDKFNEFVDYCRFKDSNVLPVIHSVRRKNGKQAVVFGLMMNNPDDNSLYFKEFGEVFPLGLDTKTIYNFPDGIDDKNTIFAESN
jgi:hypothetical protein